MSSKSVAELITQELLSCKVELVASLPDNWIAELIEAIDRHPEIRHVPVNREESAIGLCSGAYMGGVPSVALMGASGFMTVLYAITKINYTYEIPLLSIITLRGVLGDHHKHHVSNGLYLLPVLDTLRLPYAIVDKVEDIDRISAGFKHTRNFTRPFVIALTHNLLKGH